MARRQRLADQIKPEKTKYSLGLLVLCGIIAYVVVFPPWQSKQEIQEKTISKVMKKVDEGEKKFPQTIERSREIAGTPLRLTVITASPTQLDNTLNRAYMAIDRLLKDLDPDSETSELGRINHGAGKQPVKVGEDFYRILKELVQLSEKTEGYFDITLKPFLDLYKFDKDNPVVADLKELEKRMRLIGCKKILLDDVAKSVFLKQDGMGLDLRLIRNSLVLRILKRELEQAQFKDYFVVFGADALSGGKRLEADWKLRLQHPRQVLFHYGVLTPRTAAVMTANDFAKAFIKTSFRYHPILDPHTGIPAQSVMTATVTGADPVAAQALSNALFIAGPEKGLPLLAGQAGYEAVLMDRTGAIATSEGMKALVTLGEGKDI